MNYYMWADIVYSFRQELIVTVIIFLLLLIKIGSVEYGTEIILRLVNLLLLANLILGFWGGSDSAVFSGMFHTNRLVVLEKNLLNLGTLIISLQGYEWL